MNRMANTGQVACFNLLCLNMYRAVEDQTSRKNHRAGFEISKCFQASRSSTSDGWQPWQTIQGILPAESKIQGMIPKAWSSPVLFSWYEVDLHKGMVFTNAISVVSRWSSACANSADWIQNTIESTASQNQKEGGCLLSLTGPFGPWFASPL